jgi:hypothetical protein
MTKQIPLTQGQFAIVDDEFFEELNKYKWHLEDDGRGHKYAVRKVNMGRQILELSQCKFNEKNREICDHKNRDTLDYRLENLRTTNDSKNHANSKMHKNNTSGFRGVSWHKRDQVWQAYIKQDFKILCLGYHKNVEDAARAYDEKAREVYGEFAQLNFPDMK